MDVVKANQFYSSSLRVFYNSILSQQQFQLDSKLIAFYTILTVALSVILLSFRQSRQLTINTVTYPYPFVFNKVKKCFKCLKCNLKVVTQYKQLSLTKNYAYCLNCTKNNIKYLKLKRLRNIAAASYAVTKFTCKNYLFKPLNTTLIKMRKSTTVTFKLKKSNISSASILGGNGLRKRELYSYSTADMYHGAYGPATESSGEDSENSGSVIMTCQSYPTFNSVNNQETASLRRTKSLPKINSRVRLYKKLPLRTISRAWGEINSIDLPVWCRKPCFYFYSWIFNCNLDEIDIDDITEYKNLSEFFRRGLKPNVRIIDHRSCLISPCDGKILHFGKVDKGYLEQVKGVNYSLKAFLGEQNWPKNDHNTHDLLFIDSSTSSDLSNSEEISDDPEQYEKSILYNPKNCLYHCIIYLAPGDYHRFHSPTDWEIFYRRHFPGELFSVNPSVARWLQGLFNLNERVVYYGQWKYGFFSMTPVGATNVGSIKVYADQEMTTNNKNSCMFEKGLEKSFSSTKFSTNDMNEPYHGVKIKRGEAFGEFNLGSTIVLIFEAPDNFEFNVSQNQKVLYGSKLGSAVFSSFM